MDATFVIIEGEASMNFKNAFHDEPIIVASDTTST
jgi:hypothetical protein